MTSVVLPTLAVAGSWLLFALVLAGCGYLVRLALTRLAATAPEAPSTADLWIGVAAVIVYLLLWNQAFAVTWPVWVIPGFAAAAGLVLAAGRLRHTAVPRPSYSVIAVAAILVLGLANQALAQADDYDFGLYHLGVIHYAELHSTIPGLANLQTRFGAGDGHLLLTAFLDHGPWAGAGAHLVNGLLALLFCVEIAGRFVRRGVHTGLDSFTNRLALLLIPAAVVLVVWRPTQRISSPSLDFAAFVLVAVGMLYLAECVERGFTPTRALAAAAALAAASATRPLYWFAALWVIALAAVFARRTHTSAVRAAALAGVLPVLTAIGWIARQTVLSGYPLFPTTTLRAPVDWRVPLAVVNYENSWDHAWARQPAVQPSVVLHSWHWLTAFWLKHTAQDPDVAFPLLVLGCLALALLPLARGDQGRSRRLAPMIAVVLPCLITLVAWFFIAPDPRFVWGPIWIVPLALVAWALPSGLGRPPLWLGAAVAGGIVAIVVLTLNDGGVSPWLVPGVVGAGVVLALAVAAGRLRRLAAPLAAGFLVTVLVAGIVAVSDIRGVHLIRGTPGGPLGTPPNPTPGLIQVTTDAGLVVRQPAQGGDQCWQATLCVPQLEVTALAMRGATLADGFKAARHLNAGGAG